MSLLKLEKRAGIAAENTGFFFAADVERLDSRNRFSDQTPPLLRIEWSFGRKQATRRTKVSMPTCRRTGISVQGGIGIEHLEVIAGRLFFSGFRRPDCDSAPAKKLAGSQAKYARQNAGSFRPYGG